MLCAQVIAVSNLFSGGWEMSTLNLAYRAQSRKPSVINRGGGMSARPYVFPALR